MAQTHTLTRAVIEAHDPEGGRGGRWLCPLPDCAGHTDPRRHRSLSVAEDTGFWHCHRCHGEGQLKDRWKPFEGRKSKKEIDQEASRRRRAGLSRALDTHTKPIEPPDAVKQREAVAACAGLQKIQTDRAALLYLESRGFSSSDALQLVESSGVRFAPRFNEREATEEKKARRGTPSIVFPIRDAEGRLAAAHGRFLKPWSCGAKFDTAGDRKKGVFATAGALEAMEQGQPVAIVEAPFDALSLALAGLPAVALCGSGGVPAWLTRRAFGRRFVLGFDADDAGDAAAEKIGGELRALSGKVFRLRPEGAKDFNETLQVLGLDALRALIAREAESGLWQGSAVKNSQEKSILPMFATAPNPAPATDRAGTSESFGGADRSTGRTEAGEGISEKLTESSLKQPQNSPKTTPDRYQKSIETVSDSGDFADFSDGSTRGRARELVKVGELSGSELAGVGRESDLPESSCETPSDLPRETDPEFPAWLAYAKATGGSVADFETWQADRVPVELAELGRIVEDLLAAPEEAGHASAWADALEWLETLEPLAWPRSHCLIPCVATWLRFAGERRNRFRRLYGPDWATKSNIGASLAQDLTELRRFLLSIPEEVRRNTYKSPERMEDYLIKG